MEEETYKNTEEPFGELALDELLESEGIIPSGDMQASTALVPYCGNVDCITLAVNIESKSLDLSKKMTLFKNKVNRLANSAVSNSLFRTFSDFFKKFSDQPEETLMGSFVGISGLSKEIHSELGTLLSAYSQGFSNLDALYNQRSVELVKYIGAKEKFRAQLDDKLKIKKALEEKLASIRTKDGLSLNEIKYSDALINVTSRLSDYNAGLNMESNSITRCTAEKKKLSEERLYHGGVLSTYVEAFSLCKGMIEFFDVTIPMYISSVSIVRNLSGLADTVDKIAGLSAALHAKTQEGLDYVSNFNERNMPKLLQKGSNGRDFMPDDYINGLLT